METKKVSASDLKRNIEHKAFVYGVSPAVCALLGEYAVELIRESYAKRAKNELAPNTVGQY